MTSTQSNSMSCPLPNEKTELTYTKTNLYKPLCTSPCDTNRMEVSALFISLIIALIEWTLTSLLTANVPGTPQTQQRELEGDEAVPVVRVDGFSLKCELQSSAREPAFSMNGDYVIGGVFSIHHYREQMKHEYTTKPEPSRCTGRSVNRKQAE